MRDKGAPASVANFTPVAYRPRRGDVLFLESEEKLSREQVTCIRDQFGRLLATDDVRLIILERLKIARVQRAGWLWRLGAWLRGYRAR